MNKNEIERRAVMAHEAVVAMPLTLQQKEGLHHSIDKFAESLKNANSIANKDIPSLLQAANKEFFRQPQMCYRPR